MTVVITVTVLKAIFLLNYPCVFTNTEVSHSSHFSYTFISLSLFFLSFLFLLDLWWDLYRLRFLILLWSYIWIIITFKSLNTILRKWKRWNHTFHRDPVTLVNLYRAPGSPSSQGQQHGPWFFLMETIEHSHAFNIIKTESEKFLSSFLKCQVKCQVAL